VPSTADDRLTLADWRRRVAELYAEVRALARLDPAVAWDHWRATREWLFREHPQSPVPAARRDAFRASHWPYDASLRFQPTIEPAPDEPVGDPAADPPAQPTMALPMSGGGDMTFRLVARLEIPFAAGTRRLGLYWMAGYAGGLFLPFRDATNGCATYGAGRYLLDTAKGADLGPGAADGSLVVDFNFSFQPSCAFDPRWACPLAPPENRLDLAIEAGERIA